MVVVVVVAVVVVVVVVVVIVVDSDAFSSLKQNFHFNSKPPLGEKNRAGPLWSNSNFVELSFGLFVFFWVRLCRPLFEAAGLGALC